LAWYGKNLTQQKYAFTNEKKCSLQHKINTKVAFYDIRPGNGAGLFSKEKISKGGDKKEKVKKKG